MLFGLTPWLFFTSPPVEIGLHPPRQRRETAEPRVAQRTLGSRQIRTQTPTGFYNRHGVHWCRVSVHGMKTEETTQYTKHTKRGGTMALGYLPRIKHKSTTLYSALLSFTGCGPSALSQSGIRVRWSVTWYDGRPRPSFVC